MILSYRVKCMNFAIKHSINAGPSFFITLCSRLPAGSLATYCGFLADWPTRLSSNALFLLYSARTLTGWVSGTLLKLSA